MMRSTWVMAILLCSLAVSAALAVGKLSSDPNAAKRNIQPGTKASGDELDRKITYESKNKSLHLVLDDFASFTGIRFRCGSNGLDWQVRDRKVNIFAKDIPLKELMDSIARVTKLTWAKEDASGSLSYRLCMSKTTAKEAEDLRKEQIEKLRKWSEDTRKRVVNDFLSMDGMSDAQLQQMKDKNISLYEQAQLGSVLPLAALANKVPAIKNALFNGKKLTYKVTDMTPEQQQLFLKAFRAVPWTEEFGDIGTMLPNLEFIVNTTPLDPEAVLGRQESLGIMTVQIEVDGGTTNTSILLEDPDNASVKLRSTHSLQDPDGAGPALTFEQEDQAMIAESKRDDTLEPAIEHPDDPGLQKTVKIDQECPEKMSDALAALSKASGFAIVSDSFGQESIGYRLHMEEKAKLQVMLNRIGDASISNWERHGRIIELRDRKWFRKITWMIPDAWLDEWRTTAKTTGTLDIDKLAQIASLTPWQFEMNVARDEALDRTAELTVSIIGSKELLLLYGALTAEQRAAIYSKPGLDLRTLAPEQWTLVKKLYCLRNNAEALRDGGQPLILSGTCEKKGKIFNCKLKLFTSPDIKLDEWDIKTPEYRQPIKQPAKT